MTLRKKRIVIIGGSSGMGFATAKAALEKGAEVIIAGRSLEKLERAKNKLDKVIIKQVDICDEKVLEKFFIDIGSFDHFQLPGSETSSGPFLSFPIDQAKLSFVSKFWGAYNAAKYAVPFINEHGSITFFSGRFSQRPTAKGVSVLAAVNAAIEGLARALAVELSPIRVNTICPGLTKTELFSKFSEEERSKFFEKACSQFIIQRPAQPEEMARAAVYLMESTYSTGTTLFVDAGFTLR